MTSAWGNLFKTVYVITSSGSDIFADMAFVSILSLRIANPRMQVVAVCDSASATALKNARHKLLDLCEMVSVPTPDGVPTYRNRWIKSQLNQFVQGNVLYIDADTIIRRSLADIPALVEEFGGVSNENRANVKDQGCKQDVKVYEKMGWSFDFPLYVNGGVWFYKPTPRVATFFQMWHQYWKSTAQSPIQCFQDQPPLNKALLDSKFLINELPAKYNLQLSASWEGASEAVVWHFYSSQGTQKNFYSEILAKAKTLSPRKFERFIKLAMEMPAPWPNLDPFARFLACRADKRGETQPEEWLWLNGRRKEAVRFFLGKLKQCIISKSE
jgi:hypothetical protein